ALMVVKAPSATAEQIQSEIDRLGIRPPLNEIPSTIISPGGEMAFFTQSSKDLTQDEFDSIMSEKYKIYIMGEFTYEDVFGERHFTRVFASYNAKERGCKTERGYTDAN